MSGDVTCVHLVEAQGRPSRAYALIILRTIPWSDMNEVQIARTHKVCRACFDAVWDVLSGAPKET